MGNYNVQMQACVVVWKQIEAASAEQAAEEAERKLQAELGWCGPDTTDIDVLKVEVE